MEIPTDGHGWQHPHELAQTELSSWFWDPRPAPRRKPFRFMDLPPEIRRKIYKLVLVFEHHEFNSLNHVPSDAVGAVNWLVNNLKVTEAPDNVPPAARQLGKNLTPVLEPLSSLFLVSRAVRNECRAILFSETVIAVSLTRYGGLQPLENIGPLGWRSLRMLTVRMQPCECRTSFCRIDGWPAKSNPDTDNDEVRFFGRIPNMGPYHTRCLSSHDTDDERVVEQWERICATVAQYALPNQLKLFLVFEVDDVALAKRIVEPLDSLPRLQGLSLSFGSPRRNAKELRQLARATVNKLLRFHLDPRPFRFMDLPTEIQAKILDVTELGSVKTVKINLKDPITFEKVTELDCSHCCILSDRVRCSRHVQPASRDLDRGRPFCAEKQVAFRLSCQCAPFSTSYYRVSREFKELAQDAFYSQTEFDVFGWVGGCLLPMQPASNADENRPGAPDFFRHFLRFLEQDGVHQLRTVRLIFPPITPSYLTPKRAAWAVWLNVLDMLVKHADLPRLDLTIAFSKLKYGTMDTTVNAELLEAYSVIFAPMKQLQGLEKLTIRLDFPSDLFLEEAQMLEEMVLRETVPVETAPVETSEPEA